VIALLIQNNLADALGWHSGFYVGSISENDMRASGRRVRLRCLGLSI
jgi:hypothetical protein